MKRKDALTALRVAGYHDDNKGFVRVYVENRIAYPTAIAEFRKGAAQKQAGMRCDCHACKAATPAKSYMADPPCRRSTPDYHAHIAIRELPSCEIVALVHPDDAEHHAATLNAFMGQP